MCDGKDVFIHFCGIRAERFKKAEGVGRAASLICEKQSSHSGLFFLSQSEVASGLNGRLRTALWTNSILQHC